MRSVNEQVDAAARFLPREVLANAGAAAVSVAVVATATPAPHPWLWAWLGGAAAVSLRGIWTWRRGSDAQRLRDLHVWRALCGGLWGLLALVYLQPLPAPAIACVNTALAAVVILAVLAPIANTGLFALLATPALGAHVLMLAVAPAGSFALAVSDALLLAVILVLQRRLAVGTGAEAVLNNRARELEERLAWTTEAFRAQQQQSRREEALAHQVFDRLTRGESANSNELRRWVRPAASFSGDLVLHAHADSGSLSLLLCDFTGHGLPAALGAIPVSGVFHTMARKEYGPAEIATELDRRLAQMLPPDYFCCACALRLSPDRRRLEVCNAGMPPVLVVDSAGNVIARHTSHLLPLGITGSPITPVAHEVTLDPGSVIYLFSDGLVESENAFGESFGVQRLESGLATYPPEARLDAMRSAVDEFLGAMEPADDISLIELVPMQQVRVEEDVPAAATAP